MIIIAVSDMRGAIYNPGDTDRIITEGENMAISPDAQIDLHKQGKLYIPDFIANAGGVIRVFVE